MATRWLCAWVEIVRRHAVLTVAACALATGLSLWLAAGTLGLDSNTIRLFPEDLAARRNHDAFVALFPDLENAVLIVLDAETPDLAREAAERLRERLAGDTAHFDDVYLPAGGAFFERHALLYRSVDELHRFGDQLLRVQPVVAALQRDGSIANLASLVELGLRELGPDGSDDALWSDVLDRIGQASVEVYEEHPVAVSWEEVLVRGSALAVTARRVLVTHPVLDFSQALPAAAPLAAIREAASDLGIVPERGVRMRVTGNPALTHEETLSIVWDIGVAGCFCLLIVCGILTLALRSARLVAAAVITLLTGLAWTAAFAGAAVGDLNVISVAAGVLFLGLGIDFGIHLCMRYAERLQRVGDHARALREATRSVGGSLVLCTVTTSIGFFAFLPTDYQGVAELGLITGVGLVLILFLTLTLLPALLSSVLRVDPVRLGDRGLQFRAPAFRMTAAFLARHPVAIRSVSLAAAMGALLLLPATRFDANIVDMRDPSTESVQTFNDLLAEAGASSPWYANSVVASLDRADALKREISALDEVERAITLSDYVPDDQEEKLEILADIAFLMDAPPGPGAGAAGRLDEAAQVEALRRLHAFIGEFRGYGPESPLRASVRDLEQKLATFLARADDATDPGPALAELESILLSSLPAQLERLQRSLATPGVTRADLPERLVARLMAPDGRARIQAFPRDSLRDEAAFARFVDAVLEVDPDATGVAVNLVAFSRTTQQAFRQALSGAVVVIATILWILWRRPREVVTVLAPLF
ncbi:MAG: MMPL family transporter, partial [Myxococcota bacterium]|nr:MMPL family transporter [Myxococcota bacterium]